MSGQPLETEELSSLYSAAQIWGQDFYGVAHALVGAAAWGPGCRTHRGEALGLGETQPNAKGQSGCNSHISILRLPPTLLTHMVLIIIFKWKFR